MRKIAPFPWHAEPMPPPSAAAQADPELVTFAVELAERAGDLCRELFYSPSAQARTVKPDGTEVTEADLRVEDLIRAQLDLHSPDVAVYGEERGGDQASSRHWVREPSGEPRSARSRS
jgi:histidinol-phosphatase